MNLSLISLAATFAFGVASLAQAGGSCGSCSDASSKTSYISAEADAKPSIFEIALTNEAPSFKVLATLVAAADLDTALMGGEFTVFAPTDEAFGKLPEGTASTLLAEDGRHTLKSILKYHVIPSKILAGDIPSGTTEVQTLGGEMLTIVNENGTVTVNGKKVVATDVEASNGVIHVVGDVLLPQS
jgi:uncharacterized surface protein with fasciclin (FAS1) repeats